jgi:hypothetical protein
MYLTQPDQQDADSAQDTDIMAFICSGTGGDGRPDLELFPIKVDPGAAVPAATASGRGVIPLPPDFTAVSADASYSFITPPDGSETPVYTVSAMHTDTDGNPSKYIIASMEEFNSSNDLTMPVSGIVGPIETGAAGNNIISNTINDGTGLEFNTMTLPDPLDREPDGWPDNNDDGNYFYFDDIANMEQCDDPDVTIDMNTVVNGETPVTSVYYE